MVTHNAETLGRRGPAEVQCGQDAPGEVALLGVARQRITRDRGMQGQRDVDVGWTRLPEHGGSGYGEGDCRGRRRPANVSPRREPDGAGDQRQAHEVKQLGGHLRPQAQGPRRTRAPTSTGTRDVFLDEIDRAVRRRAIAGAGSSDTRAHRIPLREPPPRKAPNASAVAVNAKPGGRGNCVFTAGLAPVLARRQARVWGPRRRNTRR